MSLKNNDFKTSSNFGKEEFKNIFKHLFDTSSVTWPSSIFCLRCNAQLPKDQTQGCNICDACLSLNEKTSL